MQYFGVPEGRVEIQMMSKNIQQYHTLKCLIRDLLSKILTCQGFKSFARSGEWDEYKYCVIFVLVLRVTCALRSRVG